MSEKTDVVFAMFDAALRGDDEATRSYFTDGATIWVNVDQRDMNVDEWFETLKPRGRAFTSFEFADIEMWEAGNTLFRKHFAKASLVSGKSICVPIIWRFEIGDDGLIQRMEEYYDNGSAACVAECIADMDSGNLVA